MKIVKEIERIIPLFKGAIFFLAFSLAACSIQSSPPYQIVTLPTGKQIKVLGVGKMFFSEGQPALMCKYQTDLPIDDTPALEKEADEIWSSFKAQVEKAGFTNGIISASEAAKGFIVTTSRTYTFVYVRASNGEWSRLPNKPTAK